MLIKLVVSSIVFFIISTCSVSFSAEQVASPNPELMRVKATFESSMQKINDEDLEAIVMEQEKVTGALKVLQKQLQTEGKLDQLLVINGESERFAAMKRIEVSSISKLFPDLAALYNAYAKVAEKLPVERARKITTLAQSYDKVLANLQESFTKKNEMDDALAVKAERDALQASADIVSAKDALANYEAKLAQNKRNDKPAEKPVAVVAPNPKVEPKPTVKKKKYTGSPEKRIRQRFDEFCKLMAKQEYTKALDIIDPEFIERVGEDVTRKCLMYAAPFLSHASDTHKKLGVDSVNVGIDGQSATLTPKIWINNRWIELAPNRWVEREDDWYFDASPGEIIMRESDRRGERPPAWKPPYVKEKRVIRGG